MAQTMVNFRMDSELKKNMEEVCSNMGMSMTTAFTIFAKTVTRENRIPFEVTADPFYSKSNIDHLKKVIKSIEDGTAKLEKHDLVNVKKYENGCILLEPYELVRPDTISEKTLAEMDNAAANFKSDNVSSDIDFSDF